MWDGEGGWCGWGVDYLTKSTRPRSKKKGQRQGGRIERRRIAGEEAALQEEGSPARRRRCKKKGSRRGGSAVRRRVVGEEAELPVSSSEGLNLESKEEQWKCGFWWEGGGEEIDISAVAEKFRLVLRETSAQMWFKWRWWTLDDEASCVSHTRRCAKIFYIASHTILSSKLFMVYLNFSLCFERQNGVTEGKDG